VGRDVRAGGEVPRASRCRPAGDQHVRAGAERAHLADGEDEPRRARADREPRAAVGDTFARDLHPDTQVDYVLANPPFNIKDWARSTEDVRWAYGVPPKNNANYAWMQHILSKLAPNGSAGVVMANGSMSSNSGGEGQIRANLVEADLVSCLVALPTQLFRSTGIPVCVWFFARDKAAGSGGSVDRTGEVLFIDARNLGHMVDRAERELGEEDIAKIDGTFHAWRGH